MCELLGHLAGWLAGWLFLGPTFITPHRGASEVRVAETRGRGLGGWRGLLHIWGGESGAAWAREWLVAGKGCCGGPITPFPGEK